MRRAISFVLAGAFLLLCPCFLACAPSPANDATPTVGILDVTPTPSPSPTQAVTPSPAVTPALIDVVLYLPDETGEGLVATPAQAEDSPQGLIAALVSAGALPNVNYGRNITCTVAEETLEFDEVETSGVFVHLDLADAFAQAVKQAGASAERLMLQSLANTLITRYSADGLILSIEGTDLETLSGKYNRPIGFDELAQTRQTDPVVP